MRRWLMGAAIASLAPPALAAEFSLSTPLVSTASVVIPFSAKETFGQPVAPAQDPFPGENRQQNVEFEIRGGDGSTGSVPGVTVTATRSAFPTPEPLYRR